MRKSDLDFELTKMNGEILCINRNNKKILFDYISRIISDGVKNYGGLRTTENDIVYNSSCVVGSGGITYRFAFKNVYETVSRGVLTLRISNGNYKTLQEQVDILQDYHEKIQQLITNKKLAAISVLTSIPVIALSLIYTANTNAQNKIEKPNVNDTTYVTESDKISEDNDRKAYETLYREVGIKLYGENFTQNMSPEMDEEIKSIVEEILKVEQGYQKQL